MAYRKIATEAPELVTPVTCMHYDHDRCQSWFRDFPHAYHVYNPSSQEAAFIVNNSHPVQVVFGPSLILGRPSQDSD